MFKSVRETLNKEQREGLARWFDTLSAGAMIGAVAGTFGANSLPHIELFMLLYISLGLLAIGIWFRQSVPEGGS